MSACTWASTPPWSGSVRSGGGTGAGHRIRAEPRQWREGDGDYHEKFFQNPWVAFPPREDVAPDAVHNRSDEGHREEAFDYPGQPSIGCAQLSAPSCLVGDLAFDPVTLQVVAQHVERRGVDVQVRAARYYFAECPLDPGLGRIREESDSRATVPSDHLVLPFRPAPGNSSSGAARPGSGWRSTGRAGRRRRFIPRMNSRRREESRPRNRPPSSALGQKSSPAGRRPPRRRRPGRRWPG